MVYQIGNIVKDKRYGSIGIITEIFKSWQDLKDKKEFLTLDPGNESIEMDAVEKIINGDPKDGWLLAQEIHFSSDELNEYWYSVRCFSGGSIWMCESSLEMVDNALN